VTDPRGQSALPASALAKKILFVGASAFDIAFVLGEHEDEFLVSRSHGTADTIALVIGDQFAHVVVDQSAEDAAVALLIPLLASSAHDFTLFVVAQDEHSEKYRQIVGVDRVMSARDANQQLRDALGLKPKPAIVEQIEPATQEAPALLTRLSIFQLFRNRGMTFISNSYKNAAFVLLGSLFSAFTFYAVLIGFFLFTSSWGAPAILSAGHDLVVKTEQQINDMKVNANLVSQRVSEAELEASKAERAMFDADLLVGYVLGTVSQEIENRQAQLKSMTSALGRTRGLKRKFEQNLSENGVAGKLKSFYAKRLIDRKAMTSNTLGLLEASQRLSGIQGEIDTGEDDIKALKATVNMLSALKLQLLGAPMEKVQAASADLMLLTKQAIDARSALDQAKTQNESARERLTLLTNSKDLIDLRIAEVKASPLGRAIDSQVNVIFVPYGNDAAFETGRPLYTCSLTIIWCHRAGKVGHRLPGEFNSVHPFFGKPIRGYFVEAILDDPDAASREIIHGKRAPFFF
jgi:hypothetical protein